MFQAHRLPRPRQGPGRDLVKEYVEAARAEGMRVGFYYSLMDWHHPDGARCATDEAARQRFVAYIHGQIRELLIRSAATAACPSAIPPSLGGTLRCRKSSNPDARSARAVRPSNRIF
jgi:hypothetical protein